MPLLEQKLLTILEHQRLPSVFMGDLVTRSLVLCVCFVYRCLFFCPFSFGHCVVYSSMIYGFWLPLWYLQALLIYILYLNFGFYFLNKIPLTLGCLWNISYLYISIVALFLIYIYMSSGTDILYGCHLLLDVCIIYFISCDCIMNSSLSYPIY